MTPGLFDVTPTIQPPSIPKGHGRYLFRCSGNHYAGYAYHGHVSVPCPPVWLTLPEERHRASLGYGRYETTIRPVSAPVKCPCGAWLSSPARLWVSESAQTKVTHTCENTCQWSESTKCRCACGGTQHGVMLRDPWH